MERKMLINAAHSEEIRIAIIESNEKSQHELVELEVEFNFGKKLKGNIYKGRVSRIEPSLQAAFVDIGIQRNAFLQINDIHPSFFNSSTSSNGSRSRSRRPLIQNVLSPGQDIVVQVVKEERNLKGATLTTFLSLPGRYVVLMPGSDRGGISRKINDSEQRHRLKKLTNELALPTGVGLIVRTAGLDRSLGELSRDLSNQLSLWTRIVSEGQTSSSPSVLYQESDVATRVVRDYFAPEIREIIIDNETTYNKVKEFVQEIMPRYRSRVKFYDQEQPLFSKYHVDQQVEATLKPTVKLKSGGEIVIDTLEALVAIDVNSGKSTEGGNIEETAYRTNLEAAHEIARQIRLRDLGGLIVIDFIDMIDRKHKIALEDNMRNALSIDRARIEVGNLSKFGLLEMSRQRIKSSLASQSSLRCPTCQGSGKVKSAEMVALETLRKIQDAIIIGKIGTVKARLSPGPALFLLNNKKIELAQLEKEYDSKIYVLADGRQRPDEVEFEMEVKSATS